MQRRVWVTGEDLLPMGGSGLPVGDLWAGGVEVYL
jgi:hypothetical protein